MVRSVMSHVNLSFWGYALKTAVFTLNRVPSKSVEKTPFELWTGKSPNLSFLKIWGCEAYVKRLMTTKLEPRSDKHIFVGYPKETKGYYFYNKEADKVFVARFGVFLENEFLTRGSGSDVRLEVVRDVSQGIIDDTPLFHRRDMEASGSGVEPTTEEIVVELKLLRKNPQHKMWKSQLYKRLCKRKLCHESCEDQQGLSVHLKGTWDSMRHLH